MKTQHTLFIFLLLISLSSHAMEEGMIIKDITTVIPFNGIKQSIYQWIMYPENGFELTDIIKTDENYPFPYFVKKGTIASPSFKNIDRINEGRAYYCEKITKAWYPSEESESKKRIDIGVLFICRKEEVIPDNIEKSIKSFYLTNIIAARKLAAQESQQQSKK